jgi:hypothetical protein
METRPAPARSPDALTEQEASNELINLLRKLRWIGMDDEVERVQKKLASCRLQPANSVLAGPEDTD